MKSTNNKPVKKWWHDVSLLMLGSLLTLAGSMIVFVVQTKEIKHQYEIEREDKRIANANTFIDDLSRRWSKRIKALDDFAFVRGLTTNSETVLEYENKYLNLRDIDTAERYRDAALLQIYFGDDVFDKSIEFEKDLEATFKYSVKIQVHDDEAVKEAKKQTENLGIMAGFILGEAYRQIDARELFNNVAVHGKDEFQDDKTGVK